MEAVQQDVLHNAAFDGEPTPERDEQARRTPIEFGRFRLFPCERRLVRDGELVEIGSRAFDLLSVLVRSPGAVVSKSEIVNFVWPSTIVEESNLRFQMASLRKALGADREVIKTIQGRGYLFAAEVTSVPDPAGRGLSRDAPYRESGSFTASPSLDGDDCPPVVAVIDDDDDTREALDGLLRSSGFAAQCYPSVDAFVQRPTGGDPRCLVLDVCMPGRTGLDLQADLGRAGVRMPIVFISGHADVHMSVRAMKAGAIEFLTKPVRYEELLEAIGSAVRRH